MGAVYLRGETYWIKYYSNGRPNRESARTAKESEAKKFLRDCEGRAVVAEGAAGSRR